MLSRLGVAQNNSGVFNLDWRAQAASLHSSAACRRKFSSGRLPELAGRLPALPMSLQKRIDEDLKDAMRAKDAARLSVLRLLKAALKNATIEKVGADGELNDADAIAVIRKQVKQRHDSIESFEKGGRAELAEKEKAEIVVLNHYLPQAMSAAELQKIVADTIREVGATSRAQMGAVMKALQPKIAGRADGKTLSAEVQKQLQ
jgi:uncharacterized protein YqeY